MKRSAYGLIIVVMLTVVFSGCISHDRKYERQLVRKSLKKELKRMKKQLKREILAELQEELAANQSEEREQLNNELDSLVTAKVRKKVDLQQRLMQAEQHPQAVRSPTQAVGNVKGRMLRSGVGLAQCRVKLVRLMKMQSLGNMLTTVRTGTEFETVTNENGIYRFEALPVGEYKMKWELPGDEGWIRRLRDKSDVTIKEGKTIILKPIETSKPLLPR